MLFHITALFQKSKRGISCVCFVSLSVWSQNVTQNIVILYSNIFLFLFRFPCALFSVMATCWLGINISKTISKWSQVSFLQSEYPMTLFCSSLIYISLHIHSLSGIICQHWSQPSFNITHFHFFSACIIYNLKERKKYSLDLVNYF